MTIMLMMMTIAMILRSSSPDQLLLMLLMLCFFERPKQCSHDKDDEDPGDFDIPTRSAAVDAYNVMLLRWQGYS